MPHPFPFDRPKYPRVGLSDPTCLQATMDAFLAAVFTRRITAPSDTYSQPFEWTDPAAGPAGTTRRCFITLLERDVVVALARALQTANFGTTV